MSKTKGESKRIANSGKGKDSNATRNSQGVAITPEQYEPGNAQRGDITGYYRLTMEEIEFLDAYAEHKGDLKVIQAVCKVNKKKIDNWLQKPAIRAEIAEIQQVWRLNRKMTAEHAAAKHIELMQELESDYHKIDDPVDRAKMANPRVKASETYLKAAGHFSHGSGTQDAQVVINIDLGGDDTKDVVIEGEKVK